MMDRHDCESGEVANLEVYIEVQFTKRGNSGGNEIILELRLRVFSGTL